MDVNLSIELRLVGRSARLAVHTIPRTLDWLAIVMARLNAISERYRKIARRDSFRHLKPHQPPQSRLWLHRVRGSDCGAVWVGWQTQ
jgi:hypothetical protein